MNEIPAHLCSPLLGDLSKVSPEYITQVSLVKRALERWVMDAGFRDRYAVHPEEALDELGVALRPEELEPLIDPAVARLMTVALREGRTDAYPLSTLRYRAFIREKIEDRTHHRVECAPTHPVISAWRRRQAVRCHSELGPAKADALVHAPLAIELSRGCSGGCWFCGVDAKRLEATWEGTEDNRRFFRECLLALRDVLGEAARFGFLYWATDPLDNPDYERFLADFHAILGRCPQTTTALGTRDLARTRRVLELARSLDSVIDRLSVVNLEQLERIHEHFTPEELLRVELVPQNAEVTQKHAKAVAGRARRLARRQAEKDGTPMSEEASTIACVSGFLLNMVDRTVRLVTPCGASERWPLGYRLLEHATFTSADDLHARLEGMVARHMRTTLAVDDVARLRRDLHCVVEDDFLSFNTRYLKLRIRHWPASGRLRDLLVEGTRTVGDIALDLEKHANVGLEHTHHLLLDLFDKGLFDEEPEVPEASEPSAASAAPEPSEAPEPSAAHEAPEAPSQAAVADAVGAGI